MASLPECKTCGQYVHFGYVLCEPCAEKLRGEKTFSIDLIDAARALIAVVTHDGSVKPQHMTDGGAAWERWLKVNE